MHKTFCFLGFVLLFASLMVSIMPLKGTVYDTFIKSLDPKQALIYHRIIHERRDIYIQGFLIGSILAFCYLVLAEKERSPFTKVFIFMGIALLTQFLYYMLSKKPEWIIDSLKTPEQIKLWHQVYSQMQRRYYSGFVIGIFAYILIGRGMCSSI